MLLIVWYSWRLVKENVLLEFLWKAFNVSYMEYLQTGVNFEAARGWQKESIPGLRHCDAVDGYTGLYRGEFNGYFNLGNTTGEKNRVVLQWNDDMIRSIFRSENDIPYKALEIQRELVDLTEDNWLEIIELLTPEKMVQ